MAMQLCASTVSCTTVAALCRHSRSVAANYAVPLILACSMAISGPSIDWRHVIAMPVYCSAFPLYHATRVRESGLLSCT